MCLLSRHRESRRSSQKNLEYTKRASWTIISPRLTLIIICTTTDHGKIDQFWFLSCLRSRSDFVRRHATLQKFIDDTVLSYKRVRARVCASLLTTARPPRPPPHQPSVCAAAAADLAHFSCWIIFFFISHSPRVPSGHTVFRTRWTSSAWTTGTPQRSPHLNITSRETRRDNNCATF